MQRIREIGIQQGQMPIIMIVYRHNAVSYTHLAHEKEKKQQENE